MSVISKTGIVFILCLIISGCSFTPEINMGSACDEQHSCPPGFACVQGYCIQEALVPDGDADTIPGDVDMPEVDVDRDNDEAIDVEEYPGVCMPGETRCRGNVVQWCQGGDWADVIDCGYAQQWCSNGQCTATPVDGDIDTVDTDSDYADQPPDRDPECTPGERSCYGDQVRLCNAAGSWSFISDCGRGDLICKEGQCVCPVNNTMCMNDMVMTCEYNGWIPTFACSSIDQICVAGACQSPSGDALCPQNHYCLPAGYEQEANSCLNADGNVPADNMEWCQPSATNELQCQGNRTCVCLDEYCQDARCIDMCGQCPTGQECMDITDTGLKGCLQDQNIPEDAQWGCRVDGDCPFNSACYCMDADCSSTVCISHCSSPAL